MTMEAIREFMRREPFEPFVVRVANCEDAKPKGGPVQGF